MSGRFGQGYWGWFFDKVTANDTGRQGAAGRGVYGGLFDHNYVHPAPRTLCGQGRVTAAGTYGHKYTCNLWG